MGSGTGGRYGRGRAGVTQGRAITNRDRCDCGRGTKLVIIAELKLPSIHEHGSCEGLGAGENEGPVACFDEIGHGGGCGAVVSNIGVHGDFTAGILMENNVPGRAGVRRPEDACGAGDVPAIGAVNQDRARRSRSSSAERQVKGGEVQGLRADARGTEFQRPDGGGRGVLRLRGGEPIGCAVKPSARDGKVGITRERGGVGVGCSVRRPVEAVRRAITEHQTIIKDQGGVRCPHPEGRVRR